MAVTNTIGRTLRRSLLTVTVAAGLAASSLVAFPAGVAGAATLTVTNCNDSGAGSLRQAVLSASSGDVIDFSLSPACSPITLTSGVITIGTNLTISGPGPATLAVSGNGTSGVFALSPGVTASITQLTIETGTATNGAGIDNSGSLSLTDSVLSGNSAPGGQGGAIYNASGATANVTANTFSTNSANAGGAIYNAGTLVLLDSTLSANSATTAGGGVDNAGTATFSSSTFSGNAAAANSGGASANSAGLTIQATILAGSTSGGDCSGVTTTDVGDNLSDDATCGFTTAKNDLPNVNPLLASAGLAGNGGPTPTIALQSTSPAIAVVAASLCPATDQRGVARTAPCDMGAYETNEILSQSITFTSSPPFNATVGGPTYTATATGGNSGNAVVFTIDVSATSVCSIAGAVVSFTAAGTCVIDANQAGNARYTAAGQVQQSFSVKLPQTITFTSTPPSASVGGPPYTVTATGGGSGNAVVFTIDPPANAVCAIAGSTVTFTSAGTCVIDANQAGNSTYAPAPQAQQSFSVGGAQQTITFTSRAPVNATPGGTYTVAATGGASGNPVTFMSGSITICKVSTDSVKFLIAGTCTIEANQAGNASFQPAFAQQSVTVFPIAQTIRFTTLPPVLADVGGRYKVRAVGGPSGSLVILSSETTDVCSVTGSSVSILSAGICVIAANQAGTSKYSAAAQVEQSFSVAERGQRIIFTSTPPAKAKVGGRTYKVSASGGPSGNAVVLTIDASSDSVCSIVGSVVSFSGPGTCTIDANQSGNASFSPAPQAQQTLPVHEAPVFTGTCPSTATVGQSYSCTLIVAGSPAPAITVKGRPSWMTFDNGGGSGVITLSGTPVKSGSADLKITATNDEGKAHQAVPLTVR